LDLGLANDPQIEDVVRPGSKGPAVLRAQVLLARQAFSPGEIDGAYGPNLRAAIRGFQAAHQLSVSDEVGPDMWSLLNAGSPAVLIEYDITPEDVAGPFQPIPTDLVQQSKLQSLDYESPLERLSEKFHVSPKVLAELNKGKSFDRAGERILVPNITSSSGQVKAASLLIRKNEMTVSALDELGQVMAQFPASAGSEHDPLPIGTWSIKGVARDPIFHYNPRLFWDAEPKHSKAKIAPGPNNPVGLVWIELSKPHYGIHGTPKPAQVGHSQSHGCIRLTNWDALHLASMVRPGMSVVITN
jgi:lipoprotein-anchoring transpeptidase ErfK/SrfK